MKKLKRLKEEQLFDLACIFVLINAAIWLIFAILLAVNVVSLNSIPTALRWILVVLAVIVAGVLYALQILLRRHNRVGYFLTLVALAGLVLLTFMDQVGISDLIYAVIALTPLVLLLICQRRFFQKQG
jgi:hypothetical protein